LIIYIRRDKIHCKKRVACLLHFGRQFEDHHAPGRLSRYDDAGIRASRLLRLIPALRSAAPVFCNNTVMSKVLRTTMRRSLTRGCTRVQLDASSSGLRVDKKIACSRSLVSRCNSPHVDQSREAPDRVFGPFQSILHHSPGRGVRAPPQSRGTMTGSSWTDKTGAFGHPRPTRDFQKRGVDV